MSRTRPTFLFRFGDRFIIKMYGQSVIVQVVDREPVFNKRYKIYEVEVEKGQDVPTKRQIFNEFQLRSFRRPPVLNLNERK